MRPMARCWQHLRCIKSNRKWVTFHHLHTLSTVASRDTWAFALLWKIDVFHMLRSNSREQLCVCKSQSEGQPKDTLVDFVVPPSSTHKSQNVLHAHCFGTKLWQLIIVNKMFRAESCRVTSPLHNCRGFLTLHWLQSLWIHDSSINLQINKKKAY